MSRNSWNQGAEVARAVRESSGGSTVEEKRSLA